MVVIKRLLVVFLVVFFGVILSSSVHSGLTSSSISISSSFNPVGSGARALGMGGAFIAIADDATAASWNPSGLIQLRKPEFSMVLDGVSRSEANDFSLFPQANNQARVNYTDINYLSASLPCAQEYCGRNMVFAVNLQSLYNFDKRINQQLNFDTRESGLLLSTDRQFDYKQSGGLYALGLALAVQASADLSLGFTLNLWGDFLKPNQWKHEYITYDNTLLSDELSDFSFTAINNEWRTETNRFSGINANLGLSWTVYEYNEKKVVLGFVYKTPFNAEVKRTTNRTVELGTNDTDLQKSHSVVTLKDRYYMPRSFGLGASYQHSDKLTISADIYQTRWSEFIRTAEDGKQTIAFGSALKSESLVIDTTQIHLGLEYRIISQKFGENYIIPMRAGVFYDPVPTNGPPNKLFGISLGGGIAYDTYVFDLAYQYRFGNNLHSDDFKGDGHTMTIKEHTLYTSMFYRF